MDVSEDAWVTEALKEGVHKMTDRGHGMEHTEVSIVHPSDVAKCSGTSMQWLGVHW
jgi:hypothetical protein